MSGRTVPAGVRLRLRGRRWWSGVRGGRVAAVAVVAGVAGSVCGLAVLGAGSPAAAAAPSQQGWWAQASTGASPVPPPAAPAPPPSPLGGATPAPVPSSPPSQPSAPDVPADGLLVAGGPTATMPSAYAALLYDVPSSATSVGPLTLQVAPNTGTTPNAAVQACPLKAPSFQAEQGGPMSDAPAYVTTGCANGTSDGNGNYKFDVTSLVHEGTLAVALVPVSATDRIVFAKPSSSSLPGADASSSGFASSGFTSSDATSGASSPLPASGGSFSSGSFPTGSVSASAPATASAPAVAAPPKTAQPATVSTAPAASVSTPSDVTHKASAVAVAVTVAVAILLCGLWLFAGRASVDAVTAATAEAGNPA